LDPSDQVAGGRGVAGHDLADVAGEDLGRQVLDQLGEDLARADYPARALAGDDQGVAGCANGVPNLALQLRI
jgi:hypothetical protein